MQLIRLGNNQMPVANMTVPGDQAMKPTCDEQQESVSSPWNDRVLMAAIIVTMLLSLFGYMRG
jgi:hypothetical protein